MTISVTMHRPDNTCETLAQRLYLVNEIVHPFAIRSPQTEISCSLVDQFLYQSGNFTMALRNGISLSGSSARGTQFPRRPYMESTRTVTSNPMASEAKKYSIVRRVPRPMASFHVPPYTRLSESA